MQRPSSIQSKTPTSSSPNGPFDVHASRSSATHGDASSASPRQGTLTPVKPANQPNSAQVSTTQLQHNDSYSETQEANRLGHQRISYTLSLVPSIGSFANYWKPSPCSPEPKTMTGRPTRRKNEHVAPPCSPPSASYQTPSC